MTTTAHEDQFTVGTQTIERVRQPYDTASILRRNVADLELALRTQTERAESAEAELAQARQQKPVRWHVRGNYFHDGDAAILFASMNSVHGAKVEQLYAAPVPVPHKGATHCDDCGLTWLDDGLNPLGCPYCKDTVPAPAVPTNTIPEGDDFNGTTPHMIRCIESLVSMNDRGVLAPHGLCGHSRTLLLASANRLRQQQAHVVPAVPGEWREAAQQLIDAAGDKTCSSLRCNYPMDCCSHELIGAMDAMSALLQSAEVRHD